MENCTFRLAERKDAAKILYFIKTLAEYEKMADQVVCDEKLLEETIFDRKGAEVLFVMLGEKEIGMALFFHNFSTFLGRSGIYIEDVVILEEYRGRGYGKAVFKKLASLAKERKCGRLEWWCLDWNKPSIDFYKSIGAQAMDQWTVYRVTDEALDSLAE